MNLDIENKNNELPAFFNELLIKQYSDEEIKKIIEGYKIKRKTSIRVNTIKCDVDYIKKELSANNIQFSNVPWSEEALIIENARENEIKDLKIYENGEIYLQSLSSMLPPIILDPKQNEDILDMCSAPRRKNYSNCCTYPKFS